MFEYQRVLDRYQRGKIYSYIIVSAVAIVIALVFWWVADKWIHANKEEVQETVHEMVKEDCLK